MLNFLEELVTSTSESESPERYWWWSGLAAIAAVTRKNVFLDRHFYKLYPNIFVAIISAKSGLRKGVPIAVCKGILEDSQKTRVISGCNSIQGLIHELSCQKTFKGGEVIGTAQGILVSDEFESFLTEDARALTYLTALQNTHEHEKGWTKTLKGGPQEFLKEPCLSLLVASNQALFDNVVKSKDIEGGFIARTFMVYEKNRRMINPLVLAPSGKINKKALTDRLVEISKVKGEFKWTVDAGHYYSEWYKKLCQLEIDDRTGSIERLGDQVLKATMLISLSKRSELFLQIEDIKEAIKRCEECMSGVASAAGLSGSGEGETSEAISKVLKLLLISTENKLSRKRILQKLSVRGVDAIVLDRVIESLIQANAIMEPRREQEGARKEIVYQLRPEVVARYKDYKKDENQ